MTFEGNAGHELSMPLWPIRLGACECGGLFLFASTSSLAAMATRCIASVLVLLVAASASSEFAKQVSETQLLGDSIPKVLQKQWESKLAQQKKNISSAEVALSKSLPGPVKADVTAAIKQLNEVEQKIEAALENFVKLQAKQATEISKQYSTLLTQRLSAKGLSATDETAIHKIREESQKIVNSWVPALSKIHDDAHKQFENAFRSLAEKSSKLKTPQIGDQIRVAIENIGAQLLNVLVEEQNADITLLTGIQFNLCNNYFQKAESILINLLVAAKSSQNSSPVLSTPQNAPSKPSSVKTNAKPTETQAKISETKPSPTTTNQNKPSSQSSNSKTSASEEFDYDEYQN